MNKWLKRTIATMLTICMAAGCVWPANKTAQVWAAESDPADGLIGYWTFEGSSEAERLANKASEQAVTAVKTGNGVSFDNAGGIGGTSAASFSGDRSSYLTLNLAEANLGVTASGAFTLGLWIKINSLPASNENTSIFHQEGDQNGNGRAVLTIGGTGKLGTYLDATNRYCTDTIQAEEWHHVMIAVEAAGGNTRNVHFYLDGTKTNQEAFTGNFVNGSGNIRVGAHRVNTENSAVNGIMDEIRYYNKVLSADTIKAIYELHGEDVELKALKEELRVLIQRAESLGADELTQIIAKANGILSNASADKTSLGNMITELSDAITAYENRKPIGIEVNENNVIREIPSAMFGINHRYHKYGYGTWDKENQMIKEEFNALSKDAAFGSVRYPGGTVSNLFTWKDTIGDDRTTTIAGNNFYSDAGEIPVDPAFGVDEAMTWIYDDLNADAIFVYGLGRGNPQDAADLVEYLNAPNDGSNPNGGIDWAAVRAENGHEEPYGVTRFELGNEFSDTGQNYWMSGQSENNKGVVDLYIEGDVMTISGQRSYYQTNNRVAKKGDWRPSASKSNGNPNEERYVYYVPVEPDTAEVFVAGTKWQITDSLDGAGAANVCTFDYETGKITFGDGTNGNIPAANAEITCNYKTRQAGFVAYYDAMKAVDPNIELYSGIVDRLQNEFIDKMHQKGYDAKYDGVIIHPYSNGVTGYEDSLVKAKSFSNNIATYKDKMHTVTGDDSKKVAVSEFGILSVSPASNYQTSLGHAIYIANHMIDCVNSGAAYQNKHCLVDTASGSDNLGAWQQCVIQCHEGTNGNQFVSTPSARLFSIFNRMTGNRQVSQTVTGNQVFTGSGANAVNQINVYSTKDNMGNTYVLVVNNKKESASSVEISIVDRDLTGKEITVWSMSSPDVADANTLAEPDKVTVEKTQETAAGASIPYTLEPHSVYSFKIPAEPIPVIPIPSEKIAKSENIAKGTITGVPEEAVDGDEITVTAVPNEGYQFTGWFQESDGALVSTKQTYTFTVTAEQTLIARFAKKKFTVSVTAQTGGTVSCSAAEAYYQDSVTVLAVPQADHTFDGWYDGTILVSQSASYTFSVQKNTSLTAKFTKIEQTVNPPAPIQKPKTPTGIKAKKTKQGIQISWKKVSGADGYLIYRSYKKNKNYKKIAEIKKAGTKKYLDKKAKKGKTSYYKIKSYKIVEGKKILSAKYSKIVWKKR